MNLHTATSKMKIPNLLKIVCHPMALHVGAGWGRGGVGKERGGVDGWLGGSVVVWGVGEGVGNIPGWV